jgi:alkylation response protein AidB-like acyl-CoA dehydrogenase
MSDGDYEEFRRRVRDWLAEHAVALLAQNGAVPDADDGHDAGSVAAAKEFQGKLHSAGLAGLTWPAEAGGQGLDARYEIVFQQEAADYALPTSLFNIGTGMCGPTIIAHGTSEQRDRWLAPILRGEQVWCQLFSEPDAGSDLAAVRSRAARADGGWIVNGQKIWTSHGRFADFGLALLRSDPQRPKHQGLMMAAIDMKSAGVEVRPLRQMTGLSKFDQVYLDNVFVPDDQVIGEPYEGWRVARTTLSNERLAVGGNTALRGGSIAQVIADAATYGRLGEPVLRQRIAALWAEEAVIMLMKERMRRAVLDGQAPGHQGALTKLASSRFVRQVSALGLSLQGSASVAWDGQESGADEWVLRLCSAPGLAVGGGTDEIVTTIVAERVLGLPREPRAASPKSDSGPSVTPMPR